MARSVALLGIKDLIVAPATAAGAAAVAVVRLGGDGALTAGARLFPRLSNATMPGQLVLGRLEDPGTGEVLDHCLAAWWKAPRSYTGEDLVELHLHGSPAIVEAAMRAACAAGARPAEPGEFTRRALLNGKLDLAQAEAVAALTASQTDDARRAALRQLQGGLSQALATIRADLILATALLEAAIDYPEEHLPEADVARIGSLMSGATTRLTTLLASHERGRRLQSGARVVLAGAPNAGKSSLFNALLRRERAIVSPHPGTTRDTIEASIDLAGVPLTLVDTAGLRDASEEIEAAGIARTRAELDGADLILFLVDPFDDPHIAWAEYPAVSTRAHFIVYTKADLSSPTIHPPASRDEALANLQLSTLAPGSVQLLEDAIVSHLRVKPSEDGDGTIVTAARHAEALRSALLSLEQALQALAEELSPEFIVVDLAECLTRIDSITGEGDLDEAVLDVIFSTFCLGK